MNKDWAALDEKAALQARMAELEVQRQRALKHLQAMADWCDELETEDGVEDEEFKALCLDLRQAISLLGGERNDVEPRFCNVVVTVKGRPSHRCTLAPGHSGPHSMPETSPDLLERTKAEMKQRCVVPGCDCGGKRPENGHHPKLTKERP